METMQYKNKNTTPSTLTAFCSLRTAEDFVRDEPAPGGL
jgi:hypothetical protein